MDLTDEQCEVLQPPIPEPPRPRGRWPGQAPARGPRDVLNGHPLGAPHRGALGKDLPTRYPPYQRPAAVAFGGGRSKKESSRRSSKPQPRRPRRTRGNRPLGVPHRRRRVRRGQKRGECVGKSKRGKGVREDHGAFGGLFFPSRRPRTERECWAARGGDPCRGDPWAWVPEGGEAPADGGRQGARPRPSRRSPKGARPRDDRSRTGRIGRRGAPRTDASSQALQEEMEDREALRVAAQLQEASDRVRI